MSIVFRKRLQLGNGTWLNLSRRGVSVSKRAGRLTANSRGRTSVRLGHGLSWRSKL